MLSQLISSKRRNQLILARSKTCVQQTSQWALPPRSTTRLPTTTTSLLIQVRKQACLWTDNRPRKIEFKRIDSLTMTLADTPSTINLSLRMIFTLTTQDKQNSRSLIELRTQKMFESHTSFWEQMTKPWTGLSQFLTQREPIVTSIPSCIATLQQVLTSRYTTKVQLQAVTDSRRAIKVRTHFKSIRLN